MSVGPFRLPRTKTAFAPHVPRLRFSPQDRITIGRLQYTNAQPAEGGHVLNRVDQPLIFEEFSHDEIWMLSNGREWRLDEDYFSPEKAFMRRGTGATDLDDLSRKEVPDVVWKHEWCIRVRRDFDAGTYLRNDEGMALAIAANYEGMKCLDVAMMPAKPKRNGGTAKPRKRSSGSKVRMVLREPPGPRTLFRWLALLERSGNHPAGLRDGRHRSGCRTPRITGDALLALVEYGQRYATEERPTINDLHREMKARIDGENFVRSPLHQVVCPSKAALGLYVAGLGKFFVYAGRYGIERAKRRFAIVTSGVVVTRPYERIEIDSWQVDLQTFLRKVGWWDWLDGKSQRQMVRMEFCAAMDVATKVIVGAHLSPTATTAAAVAVLRMAVSDKRAYADAAGAALPWNQHARLEALYSDGGKQFNNPEFIGKVAALGTSPNFPSGGVPSLRGSIESFFRTIGHQLVGRLPGKTFENVVAKGEYEPEQKAAIDVEELAKLITRWIVDAYHGQPHAGLGGETPHDAWIRLTGMFGVRTAPDRHRIRAIFGIPLTRRLGNGGIRVLNLRYWCEPLKQLFLDRCDVDLEVKLDPQDLGEIAVRIDGVWHLASCVEEGFEDVVLETWVRAGRDLSRTHALGAAVTQQAVSAAIRAAGVLTRNAMDREGISSVQPTAADIDRAEREIMQGWTMPAAEPAQLASERPDPLDRGVPVTGPGRVPPAPPIPDADDFGIEE